MSRYRRWYVPGGTYFFTAVTHRRRPLFDDAIARETLHGAIELVQADNPFEMVAIVLLPDHLHTVWTLPPGDSDYSLRWRRIKETFTRRFLLIGGDEARQSSSRRQTGYRGVWQKRFWEHRVRDEDDLQRCADYVHWNPKKHRLVKRVADWKWSTFHRFVEQGEYTPDWGRDDPTPDYHDPEWGEVDPDR